MPEPPDLHPETPPEGASFRDVESNLDRILIRYCLIDSLHQFLEAKERYPFVEMRELKPGAAGSGLPESEVLLHNDGLVVLVDGVLPPECKKNIRFKERNKVIKENLASIRVVDESMLEDFSLVWTRPGEDGGFEDLLRVLIESDFSLLVQRDPRAARRRRFALTHFRVRIDWPVVEAAESLGKELGLLSRHLYEDSEQYGEQIEAKFFERFGFHYTVGGRRTAAAIGAQYLRRLRRKDPDLDFRVYVGSAEARTLTKLLPELVRRYALVRLTAGEVDELESERGPIRPSHVVHQDADGSSVFVLEVTYAPTEHAATRRRKDPSRPAESLTSMPFLKLETQLLVPRPDLHGGAPIPVSLVYRAAESAER